LGANVGGFAIMASRYTKNNILAVEPVRFPYLCQNKNLNGLSFTCLKACVSPNGTELIQWRDGKEYVPGYRLAQFVDMNEGCDFLKMDIEGTEWSINPEEFDGIIRIEGQLHGMKKHKTHKLIKYLEDNYYVEYQGNMPPKDRPCLPPYGYVDNPIIHCYR
jgi:hypothetical protein